MWYIITLFHLPYFHVSNNVSGFDVLFFSVVYDIPYIDYTMNNSNLNAMCPIWSPKILAFLGRSTVSKLFWYRW